MPRKGKRSKTPEGPKRQRPRSPFNDELRERFLEAIRDGCTIRHACKLTPVNQETVHAWLNKGGRREMQGPRNPTHVEFWKNFQAAQSAGRHEALKDLAQHSKSDYRATLAVLDASGDPRFSLRTLKRRKMEAEIRAAETHASIQEILLEKARAGGEDGVPAFGLATLLDAPELSDGFKAELARYIIAKGMVTVERAKLAGPVPEGVQGG